MSSLEKSSISSSKTVSKHLKSKTSEFLACKDDSASLVDIIVNFKVSLPKFSQDLLFLMIFTF